MASPPPLDALRDMFRHHTWATLKLLDRCSQLSSEQLTATVPGTYGPIDKTLQHIVGADGRYQRRFGLAPDQMVSERDPFSIAAMRRAVELQAASWQSILDRLEQFDVTIPAQPKDNWPEAKDARNLLLLQAVHHGNDHRTHICTILGAVGPAVPDLDGWTYWKEEKLRQT